MPFYKVEVVSFMIVYVIFYRPIFPRDFFVITDLLAQIYISINVDCIAIIFGNVADVTLQMHPRMSYDN